MVDQTYVRCVIHRAQIQRADLLRSTCLPFRCRRADSKLLGGLYRTPVVLPAVIFVGDDPAPRICGRPHLSEMSRTIVVPSMLVPSHELDTDRPACRLRQNCGGLGCVVVATVPVSSRAFVILNAHLLLTHSQDSATVMCSTQNVYAARGNVARVLGMREEKVRIQYYEGSGTYGHSCYDDAAQAAAILSQAAGRPVRVQFMRWDEHGWDNYGPAHLGEVRAAADAGGRIIAYEYHGWQHNWSTVETSEQLAVGTAAAERQAGAAQQVSPLNLGSMYEATNIRLVNHRIPAAEYLKGSWLRSPLDLSFSFASEQAIDQLAYLSGTDPYIFRQRNIKDDRWLGVLNAVAQSARWTPRRAVAKLSDPKVVSGRGIAVGTHLASYGAAVVEIEVNRETGRVIAKKMCGAIDCGLAVNPGNVENQISGQLVQTASRMLKEEVTFNKTNVTSLDWNSYPILRFDECPEVMPIVVQRIDEKSTGAGEEVMAAAAAAMANAFFDATGVRMREYPFTPARVLAAIQRH